MSKKFHCPRCKNENIIEYEETFDCPICFLEFEKADFELYEESDILSINEKMAIIKTLKPNSNNSNKKKDFN